MSIPHSSARPVATTRRRSNAIETTFQFDSTSSASSSLKFDSPIAVRVAVTAPLNGPASTGPSDAPILSNGRVLRRPQRPVETPHTYSDLDSRQLDRATDFWSPPDATTTITIIEHDSTGEDHSPPSRLLSVSPIPEDEVPPSPERVFSSADACASFNRHSQTFGSRVFYPIDPAHKMASLLNPVETTERPSTPVPSDEDSDDEDKAPAYLPSLMPPRPTNPTAHAEFDDEESDDEYLDDFASPAKSPSVAAPSYAYVDSPVSDNGDGSSWDADDEDDQSLGEERDLVAARALNFDPRPESPLKSFLDMSADSDEEDEDEYLSSNRKALIFDDEFTADQTYRDRRAPDLMESVLDRADSSRESSDSESISRTDELFAVMRYQQQHPRESGRNNPVLLDDVFNPDVRVDLFTHPEPEEHPYTIQDSYILPTNSATQQFYGCENPSHLPHLQYEHCCTKSVHPYQTHSFAPLPPKSKPEVSSSSLPSSRRSTRSTAGRIVRGLTKSLHRALAKVPNNTGSADAKGKKRMRSPDFEAPPDSSSTSLLPPFRLKRSKKF
ncbi:hypothetical protein ARMSODRAFT_1023869 [Armillaria solidipes]|uniref:Uncharacterized protein n=1 Tax=Armillaria solidipes TaxID=1076256 RepID=A0A2H3BKU1_9AGAR|nr:hypothetical protein ARMSODRAFT_1023869 [Armillaria solidipes]